MGESTGIYQALISAAEEIGPIAKAKAEGVNYSVRGWETILNAVAPVLRKNGLVPHVSDHAARYESCGDLVRAVVAIECTMHHTSGEHTEPAIVTGAHPMWITTKSGNRIYNNNPEGSARTYAQRDWLCRLLMIPTEETPETTDAGAGQPPSDADTSPADGPPSDGLRDAADHAARGIPEPCRAAFKDWMQDRGYWYTPSTWTQAECSEIIRYTHDLDWPSEQQQQQ